MISQPDEYNVEVFNSSAGAAEPSSFIVPVKLYSDGGSAFDEYLHRMTDSRSRPQPVPTLHHGVEPAFALTFEKLQGATLSRLILVLLDVSSSRLGTMCPKKLFVALSRVCEGKHLALFPCDMEDMSYLLRIRHDKILKLWTDNYTEHGYWKGNHIYDLHSLRRCGPRSSRDIPTASIP